MFTAQDSTADDSMSQRNPLLLLSSLFTLLSYPPILCSTPKNTQNISDQEIIMVIFPEFGSLLRGPSYFGPELEVEKKTGWQSFRPPW